MPLINYVVRQITRSERVASQARRNITVPGLHLSPLSECSPKKSLAAFSVAMVFLGNLGSSLHNSSGSSFVGQVNTNSHSLNGLRDS